MDREPFPKGMSEENGPAPRLSILHLEDSPDDACLIHEILKSNGLDCEITLVSNRDDFLSALESKHVDLILSDYGLPGFNGFAALRIVRERGSDLPFIFVTGTLGEEVTIDSLRNGATDYVLKDRLARLAPAVTRAAEEADERRGRARAEQSLKAEQLFLKATLESLGVGVIACNADGVVTIANNAARDMHPFPLESLPLGQWATAHEMWQADGRTRLDSEAIPLLRALRGEHVRDTEISIGAADGPRRTFLVNGQPITDRTETRLGAVVALHDITDRKLLEQQFLQAQKMEAVGQLAAGVAHDFNNLLSVIGTYTELAIQEIGTGSDPLQYVDCLGEVRAAANRAATLTRQLLTFSRKQVVEYRALDLNVVLDGMDRMLSHLIGADIEFVTMPGTDIGSVLADAGQIEQIVMNLAVNARDAMPRGGRLEIRTSSVRLDQPLDTGGARLDPGNYACLTVRDSGVGMTPEIAGKIFEPFFTTKGVGKGTGLGLATVYGIVKNHQGAIQLESAPDRGTTFRIFLPRVDYYAGSMKTGPTGPTPRGHETIVVVDDEATLRDMIIRCLKEFGYTAVGARDAGNAEEVIQGLGDSVRLVLSDVVLPGDDGRTLVNRLRSVRPDLRFLLMSGHCDDSWPEDEARRIPFLQKPFSLNTLAHRVREILDEPQSAAA